MNKSQYNDTNIEYQTEMNINITQLDLLLTLTPTHFSSMITNRHP